MLDERELAESFLRVAQLANLDLAATDIRVEIKQAPHRPPASLPADSQAVYAFFLGDACLKVGKAGPKTAARYCSQHYGLHARSTLARSLLTRRARAPERFPAERFVETAALDELTVRSWIEANTWRVNVVLPIRAGPFVLSLLEAFMQCRFQPVFEGQTA